MSDQPTPNEAPSFRDGVIAVMDSLIVDDQSLDQPIHVPLDTAKLELDVILSQHASAIAELTINGAFDLIEMQRGDAYDPLLYSRIIATLDNASLVAEAEVIADDAEMKVARIARRKELAQRLSWASQTVARAILITVIRIGLGAMGIPPFPIPFPVLPKPSTGTA